MILRWRSYRVPHGVASVLTVGRGWAILAVERIGIECPTTETSLADPLASYPRARVPLQDTRRLAAVLLGASACAWLAHRHGGANLVHLSGAFVAATVASVVVRKARTLPAGEWPAVALTVIVATLLCLTGWPGTAAGLVGAPEAFASLRWYVGHLARRAMR